MYPVLMMTADLDPGVNFESAIKMSFRGTSTCPNGSALAALVTNTSTFKNFVSRYLM